MMPRDTNWMGTVFGGILLSYIDHAGAVEAERRCAGRFVTVAMREVEFVEPVYVGDLVSFYTEIVRVGRTSITVRVEVEARRRGPEAQTVRVTEAEVIYVHVDAERRPVPLPAEGDSEKETD
jgi:acyl-CoA thioesterase YciA